MSEKPDTTGGRVAWPWAVLLLLVSIVAAAFFVVAGFAENTKTGTTTGRLNDSHTVSTDGGPKCVGRLSFTVDGTEFGGKAPSQDACPEDGSDPTVTVHYDPENPTFFDTQGSQSWVFWLIALFPAFCAGVLATGLVNRVRERRQRRTGATMGA
ncbi:hypothetical protein GCM10011519_27930 [Marmoricola endophyticus]|uniref:DUF3592 domain-containing protein n=1 Tax=Marmoricola endophyticus TaxID=2040280 RepID=A0A917F832_9ACTN|nr:hypothetical protein [Marmoricola endophyticus]GGF52367.1 hypothetical protein GCM10011519_27930 [Marmoricola endophyticus]